MLDFDPMLAPCPFCGGAAGFYREAQGIFRNGITEPHDAWLAGCISNACSVHVDTEGDSSKAEAAAKWNARSWSNDAQTALRAASEAFVLIRTLTTRPMSPEAWQLAHEVADAFHNVPDHYASPAQQQFANLFVLKAGLARAVEIYSKHGLTSKHLPAV